eukprot:NODE_10269_length_1364_cov_28.817300.p1 GENE.NODE_10269_length_1364_cov_28.817300~~NODE_10269_length_1364_cov_28.817300.p1  ORF type:complete len:345 (-),score=86.13 NODE_10269_length_1364_cov_28.817300:220-1254(-)
MEGAPRINLRGDVAIPSAGLGLWKSSPADADAAVSAALSCGVRLIDGAGGYENEVGVGVALSRAIGAGIVKREDIFVVSKLFNTMHVWEDDRSRPRLAIEQTLKDLQVGYVDLYLLHWPFAFQQVDLKAIGGLRISGTQLNPALVVKEEFLETYAEMVKFVQSGQVKALGVSNFSEAQLELLLERFPDFPPVVNQVELHPYNSQPELAAYCTSKGIHLMAYSPLGSGDSVSGASFPARGTGPFENPHAGAPLLANEIVCGVAAKLGKSPAQVLIRWSLQRGYIPVSKSTRAERIMENSAVLTWSIPDDDMAQLNSLDCRFRYGVGFRPGHYDTPNATWCQSPMS